MVGRIIQGAAVAGTVPIAMALAGDLYIVYDFLVLPLDLLYSAL